MARPRIYGRCPDCGGRILVMHTKARKWCVVRLAVCAKCGRKFRFVTVRA